VRKVAGGLVLAFGVALLAYAGQSYAAGAIARDRARTAWERVKARSSVDGAFALALAVQGGMGNAPRGAPIARLIATRIGLDEVVVEGVDDRSLNAGPGHLPGSAIPGAPGNSVISAHRDRHFRALGALTIGDTIRTETVHGSATWVIARRTIVGEGRPALFQSSTPILTLTTCWPIRYLGSAPDRLILTARPVSPAPRSPTVVGQLSPDRGPG